VLLEQTALPGEGDVFSTGLLVAVVDCDDFHLDRLRDAVKAAYREAVAAWLMAKLS
jgi:hypothetical protein